MRNLAYMFVGGCMGTFVGILLGMNYYVSSGEKVTLPEPPSYELTQS